MKLKSIFALFTLIVMVKSAWWAAALNPVILSLGAVLGTIDKDVLDIQAIEWRNLLPFINKYDPEEMNLEDIEELIDAKEDKQTMEEKIKKEIEKNGYYSKEEEDKIDKDDLYYPDLDPIRKPMTLGEKRVKEYWKKKLE